MRDINKFIDENSQDPIKISFYTNSPSEIETMLSMMKWYWKKCSEGYSESKFLEQAFKSIYDCALKNPEYKKYFEEMDQREYANGDIKKAQTWPAKLS